MTKVESGCCAVQVGGCNAEIRNMDIKLARKIQHEIRKQLEGVRFVIAMRMDEVLQRSRNLGKSRKGDLP